MKASAIRRSTAEKDFVLRSIRNGIRLDGRQSYDYRNLSIEYGVDYGCCEVSLGDTRVLAQVSCEVVKPRETRPTEGELFLNVDLSPLASPAYESGRLTEKGVEINRMVERCLRESHPIDVESLCLVAGEKVWSVRVDILCVNDSGNILDCSCIAAMAALSHFRRPDVTVTGSDVIYHSFEEKEPVPLNVHHMPICISFGFIGNGDFIIVDPEEKEQSVLSGGMVLACNVHGELCCAQMGGGVSLDYEQIMQCANIASVKAGEITEVIKSALEEDRARRAPKRLPKRDGLKTPSAPRYITQTVAEPSSRPNEYKLDTPPDIVLPIVEEAKQPSIRQLGRRTAGIGEGGLSSWVISDGEESDCDADRSGNNNVSTSSPGANRKIKKAKEQLMDTSAVDDDDEEEELVVMDPAELGYVPKVVLGNAAILVDSEESESKSYSPKSVLKENTSERNTSAASAENHRPVSRKKKKKKKRAAIS